MEEFSNPEMLKRADIIESYNFKFDQTLRMDRQHSNSFSECLSSIHFSIFDLWNNSEDKSQVWKALKILDNILNYNFKFGEALCIDI